MKYFCWESEFSYVQTNTMHRRGIKSVALYPENERSHWIERLNITYWSQVSLNKHVKYVKKCQLFLLLLLLFNNQWIILFSEWSFIEWIRFAIGLHDSISMLRQLSLFLKYLFRYEDSKTIAIKN